MEPKLKLGKIFQKYLIFEILKYNDFLNIQKLLHKLSKSSRKFLYLNKMSLERIVTAFLVPPTIKLDLSWPFVSF